MFSNIKFNTYLENFTADIIDIYQSNDNFSRNEDIAEIIKIPWVFCKIYSTQQKNNYTWSTSSYDLFSRSCTRLFEFTLYIKSLHCKCLNKAYLEYDQSSYNDLIHYYYDNIETISTRGFDIIKNHSKNHIDFIDDFCKIQIKYPPKHTVQAPKTQDNLFKKFLLISQNNIRIYNADDSKNKIGGRNSNGQWGKREAFETDETDYTDALIEKKRKYHSTENKLEDIGKAKFSSSPLINNAAKKILGFQPVSENNTFKRVKIARAISANIAKQNQKLISDYSMPEPKLLSIFIKQKIITDTMHFESVLFLASLLLGINHIELLQAMMGINVRIKIDLNKHILSIHLSSSIFAQHSKEIAQYAKKIKGSQIIKTILPENILNLLLVLNSHIVHIIQNSQTIQEEISLIFNIFETKIEKNFEFEERSSSAFKINIDTYFMEALKDKTQGEISATLDKLSFLDTFFYEINNRLDSFLKNQCKSFDKTIIININKLPYIHQRYMEKLKPETNTERLFFTHMKKSEAVKMCYTSMPATYTLQKEWYLLLQEHLEIKELLDENFSVKTKPTYPNTIQNKHEIVGSPFFLEQGKAKNFFLSLSREIHASYINEVTKDTLRMIYIRYALSILLGTRDFHQSCNLQNYSKQYGILTIQEKAKDSRSAKRIIPLCNTAIELIEVFHTIKIKYNYTHYTPILLTESKDKITFETMTQNNIIKWMQDNKLEIDTNFFRFIPQNYGRHIIKSNTLNSMIKDEFIDAFLNHYSSGTEDQGLFSTFSNQTYFNEIRNFMEDIAIDYFPAYGLENLL